MRRFVLGWKAPGHAQRFCAEIVSCADIICVLGKAPAADMLAEVNRFTDDLKLTVNEQNPRCLPSEYPAIRRMVSSRDVTVGHSHTIPESLYTLVVTWRNPQTYPPPPSSISVVDRAQTIIPVSTSTGVWSRSRSEYCLPRFATRRKILFSADVRFFRKVTNTSIDPGNCAPR